MDFETVRRILKKLKFEERFNTEQTAVCILVMLDIERREGLLFNSLHDGSRIHDIIQYADHLLSKKYAENTRESIRKSSLKRLVDYGLVVVNHDNPSRPVNSGNTNYILEKFFEEILRADISNRDKLINKWLASHSDLLKRRKELDLKTKVRVKIDSETIELSAGAHNVLIKEIIESYCKRFIKKPKVLYVGDTRNKEVFYDEDFLAKMGFELDVHYKMPDVIVYDQYKKELVVFESVTSVGPFEELRKKEVEDLISKRMINKNMIGSVSLVTAFLDRNTFGKFARIIAWNTVVWIANEPDGCIRYIKLKDKYQPL